MNKLVKSVKFYINKSNQQKLDLIDQLFIDYRNLVNGHIKTCFDNTNFYKDLYFNDYYKIEKYSKNIDYFDSHYNQQAQTKAVNILSKLYHDIYDKMNFEEEKKLNRHLLRWINCFDELRISLNFNDRKEFFKNLKRLITKLKFEDEKIKNIFKYCKNNYIELQKTFNRYYKESKVKLKEVPEFKANTIQLDTRIVEMQRSKDSKFDYWFKLKTSKILKTSKYRYNKIIYLPFKINDYVKDKMKLAKSFVLGKDHYDNYYFQGVYEVEKKENNSDKEIGIDLGYKRLINTTDGYQTSKLYNNKMNGLDKVIVLLRKALQHQGLKNSKKLQRLEDKRKQLQKCFMGAEVNKVLDNKTIVIEKLDFTKKKKDKKEKRRCSRTMTRRLSIWKKKYIINLLKMRSEENNIKLIEVNPAYTSRLCPACGCIEEENRKNQWLFECVHCGYKANADINASANILRRSKDSELLNCTSKDEIKSVLMRRFEINQGSNNNPADSEIRRLGSLESAKPELVMV
jgi:IS605 OrfB family transposase